MWSLFTNTHTHIKFPILPLCGFLSLCYGHKIEMENEMGETVKRFWCGQVRCLEGIA